MISVTCDREDIQALCKALHYGDVSGCTAYWQAGVPSAASSGFQDHLIPGTMHADNVVDSGSFPSVYEMITESAKEIARVMQRAQLL